MSKGPRSEPGRTPRGPAECREPVLPAPQSSFLSIKMIKAGMYVQLHVVPAEKDS